MRERMLCSFLLAVYLFSPVQAQSGAKCACVEHTECKNNAEKAVEHGIIIPRFREPPKVLCTGRMEVCCPVEELVTGSRQGLSPGQNSSCGTRNTMGVIRRQIKRNETHFGEFPWLVAVYFEDVDEQNVHRWQFECSGSLIHMGVVLTAAHCVVAARDGGKFKVRAGEYDLDDPDQTDPYQENEVSSVVIHPDYHSGSLRYDIALLFLYSPVNLAPHIGVACLAGSDAKVEDRRCIHVGWWKELRNSGLHNIGIVKKIDLTTAPHDQCQQQLRATRLHASFKLHSSFLCTNDRVNKSQCHDDAGSPLACLIPGSKEHYEQIGVSSWGAYCGEHNLFDVYVSVPALRAWIDTEMRNKGFVDHIYTYS